MSSRATLRWVRENGGVLSVLCLGWMGTYLSLCAQNLAPIWPPLGYAMVWTVYVGIFVAAGVTIVRGLPFAPATRSKTELPSGSEVQDDQKETGPPQTTEQ